MIKLLEIVEGEDRFLFENDAMEGETLGDIEYSNLSNISGTTYSVTVNGLNVQGDEFEEQDIDIEIEGTLNATKIFIAIAKALKATLCPHCV